MKAKEYYTKYGDRLVSADEKENRAALCALMSDFAKDTAALMDTRKPHTNKAVLAIVDEINNRWNALCEMFPVPVLKRNGWKTYFMGELAKLKS